MSFSIPSSRFSVERLQGGVMDGDLDEMINILNSQPDPANEYKLPQIREELEHRSRTSGENTLLTIARDAYNPKVSYYSEFSRNVVGLANAYVGSLSTVRTVYISEIAIDKREQYRVQGVGSLLLQECIDWAEENDAEVIESAMIGEHNKTAIHTLYAKHGFGLTGDHRRYLVL